MSQSTKQDSAPPAIQCSCGESTKLEEAYYCRKCEEPRCTLCWDESIELLYCPSCWERYGFASRWTLVDNKWRMEAGLCRLCKKCPQCAFTLDPVSGACPRSGACTWTTRDCHESERQADDGPLSTELTSDVPALDASAFTAPPVATSPSLQQLLDRLPHSPAFNDGVTTLEPTKVRLQSKTTLRCRECDTLLYKPDIDPSVKKPKYECRAADHLPRLEARFKSRKLSPP